MLKFFKIPCLIALFFVFAALNLFSYEQVQIDTIIPIADKKFKPTRFELDPSGNFWVLNQRTKSLHRISKEGRTSQIISPSKETFKNPSDFQFLKDGSLLIADPGSKKVVLLKPYDSPGGSSSGGFDLVQIIHVPNPSSVAVSEDDILAVANNKANLIQMYSIDGVLLHYVFPDSKHPFKKIVAMAFSKDGVLWVLDAGSQSLHRYKKNRKLMGIVQGLKKPQDLVIDDYGYAYVSSAKGRWYEINPEGQIQGTFGTKGKKPGQLNNPSGLVIEDNQRLWVAETGNRRLQSFKVTNSLKVEKLRPDPVARIQVRYLGALDLKVDISHFDRDGNLLLLNRKRRKFKLITSTGTFITSFGNKGKGLEGFRNPSDFDFDAEEDLWVSDESDHTLKKVSEAGEILQMVGQKGRKEGFLKGPSLLKIRSDSSFVVADKSGTRVQVLSAKGLFLFLVGSRGKGKGMYSVVTGMAVNEERIALIDAERKALLFYDSHGKYLSQIANREARAPVWNDLADIETDELGRFYVLDRGAKRIRIFNRVGLFIADLSIYGNQISLGPEGRLLINDDNGISLYDVDFVPEKLKNLEVVDKDGIVGIQWEGCESCLGYQVYRSSGASDFTFLRSSKETMIQDDRVRPGLEFRYAVRGVNRMGYEGTWTESEGILPSKRWDLSLVSIEGAEFRPVFTAAFKYYVDHPIGSVVVRNNDERPIRNTKISISLKRYTDFPTEKIIKELKPGETKSFPVTLTFNTKVLELTENTPVQADIKVSYFEKGEQKHVSRNFPITLYSRNAIVWDDKSRLSSFITPRDPPIVEFSRSAIKNFLKPLKGSTVGKQLAKAVLFYEALNALEISYVPDPNTPFSEVAGNTEVIDYVQFPRETLRRKTGDCDDTTALLASLLESIGVEVAFVDTPGHIFLMANLDEGDPEIIGLPEERFVDYRGSLWVPIETTKLGQDFFEAWKTGMAQVRDGLEKGNIEFIPVIKASEKYPPVTLVEKEKKHTPFPKAKTAASFIPILKKLQQEKYEAQIKTIKAKIKKDPDNKMLEIQLAMAHVEGGKISDGKKIFSSLKNDADAEVQSSALNNLGNLSYLNGDYKSAHKYYSESSVLSPHDGGILINRARSAWKLGDRKSAKKYLYKAKDFQSDWRAYVTDMPSELMPKY